MNNKETLEEAAEKWYDSTEENKGFPKMKAFIAGAKWQASKMYSEKEVLDLLIQFSNERTFLKENIAIKWFKKQKDENKI